MQTGCLKTFPFLFYNSPQVRQPGGRWLDCVPCVCVCRLAGAVCSGGRLGWQRASPASHAGPPVSPALSAPSPPCTQFSVQLEAAKALNAPRVDEQAAEEKRARDLVRCRLCCPDLCCLLFAVCCGCCVASVCEKVWQVQPIGAQSQLYTAAAAPALRAAPAVPAGSVLRC